jgi:hypothetical protein
MRSRRLVLFFEPLIQRYLPWPEYGDGAGKDYPQHMLARRAEPATAAASGDSRLIC